MSRTIILSRKIGRVLVRGCALAWAITACTVEYMLQGGRLQGRARHNILHKWSAWMLPRIGVDLSVYGAAPAHGLIVSNHLSYLDVLVFSAVAPCAFVAKSEVRSWPAIGWIAAKAGAVFIDRSRRRETRTIQQQMYAALAQDKLLVLFPEGTSSDGKNILRFHSSLLHPAVVAKSPIIAAHMSYKLEGGDAGTNVCYWGTMTLLPHLLSLLSQLRIRAELTFDGNAYNFDDRKQAAPTLQAAVQQLRQQHQVQN